jgi:hypothetical protein
MIQIDQDQTTKTAAGMIMYQLVPVVRSEALARLHEFRLGVYDGFGRWADGLFEVVDALAGADRPVRSVAELTLEPVGVRGWGTFYQSLQHGVVDSGWVKDLLAGWVCRTRSAVRQGWPLLFAVDGSVVPRPDTTVVDGIGKHYINRRVNGVGATTAGWSVSWLAQVGEVTATGARTSWALPVDARQVPFGTAWTEVVIAQFSELLIRLARQRAAGAAGAAGVAGPPPLLLADAGLCAPTMTQHLPEGGQILVSLRRNRVFRGRVAQHSGPRRRGRPAVHGRRFAMKDPTTWQTPDAEHRHTTVDGAVVHTQAWHHLHPEPYDSNQPWHGIVEGTIIRQQTTPPGRAPQVRWLWWAGPADAFDLTVLAQAYAHRYTIEHMFRFLKQDLFWTGHTPLSAAQAERWTWIVALAYAQLHLSRPLAADHPAGWRKPVPIDQLSPRRVRRDFRRLCTPLPNPTNPPQNNRPGPGRPKGSKNQQPRPLQPINIKGRHNPTKP